MDHCGLDSFPRELLQRIAAFTPFDKRSFYNWAAISQHVRATVYRLRLLYMILELQATDLIDVMGTVNMMRVLHCGSDKPLIRSMVIIVDDVVLMQKEVWDCLDILSGSNASDLTTVEPCWLLKAATINSMLTMMAQKGILLMKDKKLVRYQLNLVQAFDPFQTLGMNHGEALVMIIRFAKLITTRLNSDVREEICSDMFDFVDTLRQPDFEESWRSLIGLIFPTAIMLGVMLGGSSLWWLMKESATDPEVDEFGSYVAKTYMSQYCVLHTHYFANYLDPLPEQLVALQSVKWLKREIWCGNRVEAKYPPLRDIDLSRPDPFKRLCEEIESNDKYKHTSISIDIPKLGDHYRKSVVSYIQQGTTRVTNNENRNKQHFVIKVLSYPE